MLTLKMFYFFGLHGDTEEGEEFSGNPDQGLPGLGDDSYFLKRIISSGFYYVNDRIELTFMMYEYRHQAFPNPYAQQTLTRKREKIYIKSFLFTLRVPNNKRRQDNKNTCKDILRNTIINRGKL